MNVNVHQPVVLITGASRGIGREIALAYAKRGARLVLAARTPEALAAVGREAAALGAQVLTIPTDITAPADVNTLVARAIDRFGRIDVLVNNAGIGRVGAVTDDSFEQDAHATLNASLFGMVRLTRRVVPIMRAQHSGAIVNMSSVMGRKAFARFGSYAIVMHAVSAFSDALRQELAGTGIHVAVIHPALTATELLRDAAASDMPPPFRHMTPLRPDKVAAAVISAVDRRRRRIVLPWQAHMLLLGEALSPWLGDLIARALTVRFIARLLGVSHGTTYHDTLPSRSAPLSADVRLQNDAVQHLVSDMADH
jgi:short-subunit dehydrogenase